MIVTFRNVSHHFLPASSGLRENALRNLFFEVEMQAFVYLFRVSHSSACPFPSYIKPNHLQILLVEKIF